MQVIYNLYAKQFAATENNEELWTTETKEVEYEIPDGCPMIPLNALLPTLNK